MTAQLKFESKAISPDGTDHSFEASLTSDGVEVIVASRAVPWFIEWSNVDDVEFLADEFWNTTVWEFREIIKILAEAFKARALVT
jgi:hypothetical protein